MANKVTIESGFSTYKIFINGFIHAYIVKKYFDGFQSYYQDDNYYIELWVRGKRQLLIYESEEVWKSVLTCLSENL